MTLVPGDSGGLFDLGGPLAVDGAFNPIESILEDIMGDYRVISADTHIVEPPNLYADRIEPRFRDRAPYMERRKTPTGTYYDTWILDDLEVGMLGPLVQVGRRYEDPAQIDFLAVWEDVKKSAYDPHLMVKDLAVDGVWGACLQTSQGIIWYRIPDSELLSALWRVYNDWIADFCKPYPHRLKGIGCLNVDDVPEACQELERCSKLGLASAFIPVYPAADQPYRNPRYDPLWATAEMLSMPLLLHVGTTRGLIPGCELSLNVGDVTPSGRVTNDHWVRLSLTDMIFSGVFDRYPDLKIGSVEHETGWIPFWLSQMDFTYRERPFFTKEWKSQQGMLPSDYWRHNMFVEFMEDDVGLRLRDLIGVGNMLWGNDFPHSESTWPRSMEFLDRVFAQSPEEERRKITAENAAILFGFDLQKG